MDRDKKTFWSYVKSNIRPWNTEFFALQLREINIQPLVGVKIQKNINYFFSNYLLLLTALILVGMIFNWYFLFLVIASTICWKYVISSPKNYEMVSSYFQETQYYLMAALINSLIMLYFTGMYLFTIIGIGVGLIVIHSVLVINSEQFEYSVVDEELQKLKQQDNKTSTQSQQPTQSLQSSEV